MMFFTKAADVLPIASTESQFMQRERISENVYWLQSELYAQVTAGIIVGPQWAIVVDTLALPEETLAMRQFIDEELKVPVRYLIDTHSHADHAWGNCFFPEATIIAHTKCAEYLAKYGVPALEATKKENPAFEKNHIVLPHLTFDDGELTLKVGKKNLIIMLTPGHTADGISVFIEEDRILFAGDAFMPIPALSEGNYVDTLNTYTKINALGLENIVQGHGDIILRGEIDSCSVTTNILDEWLNGDNAQYVHQSKKLGTIMYMLFNFNPKMDDEAANEAYRAAVINKNWRMSIVYGLNKAYCLSAYDPYYAEERVTNLMIPADFAMVDGKDYTEFGNLPELSKGFYDEAKALEFRDAAKAELEAAGVPLPIQIPVFYNPSTPNMDNSFQLIEKQLEELLGTDYIDITVYAGPTTNFIGEVRRPGKWGLYEQGWSPDYADPATYFEPFGYGWTFGSQEYIEGDEYKTGYIYTEEDYANNVIDDEELVGTPQMVFNSLVEAARAEKELNARYELFAKAEEYALTEGLMIPYQQYNDGYVASKLALYEAENAMAGICAYKYKGMHLLEKSYSMDEFEKATEAWEADKAK